MPTPSNTLFLEGLLFSSANVAFIVLAIWWLYLSPTRAPIGAPIQPSPRLASGLAILLGLSALQLTIGGFWDGSMHILTGEIPAGADFLWPPHLMIYSSFLISLLVAVGMLIRVAWPAIRVGERDPRVWVRRNPYLGAVALASLYSLFSVPGDALWHLLYGIDLTAWSPPHVLIAASMCIVTLCPIAVLVQVRPTHPILHRFDFAIPILLGLALGVAFLIGTIEWEMPAEGTSLLVLSNPIWVYPMVGGALAFIGLMLAKQLSRWRWAATLTMLTFFAIRAGIILAMQATDNVVPFFPPLFILGTVALDVLPWSRMTSVMWQRTSMAAVFTVAYLVMALPVLATRASLPQFGSQDFGLAALATLIVTVLLSPVLGWVGQTIRSQSPAPAVTGTQPMKTAP